MKFSPVLLDTIKFIFRRGATSDLISGTRWRQRHYGCLISNFLHLFTGIMTFHIYHVLLVHFYYTYVTHLHKTSHKSLNIKFRNCILSKNVKKVVFFVFINITFFGQDSFKIFVLNNLLDFSSIYCYFKSSFK